MNMNHHRDSIYRYTPSITAFSRFWTVVSLSLVYCTLFTTASLNTIPLRPSYATCFIHTSSGVNRPRHGIASPTCIQSQSSFMGHVMKRSIHASNTHHQQQQHRYQRRGMQLGMFLGSDGGILGVGAPEVVVTLLVGYFILGPSDLYKITKDIGKFIQNFRTLGSEATKSFETAMEDQLQMKEIRKAQRELNSAFNFRRSINVDQDGEVFAESKRSDDMMILDDEVNEDTAASGGGGTLKKKKKRRMKKKTVENVPEDTDTLPDLDMASEFPLEPLSAQMPMENDIAVSQQSSDVQLRTNVVSSPMVTGSNGESDVNHTTDSLDQLPTWYEEGQNTRFAAQMSGDWNQRILDNEEKLSPLAQVMEKLALLEEERERINQRLEEEFRLKKQNDEKYYQQKRALLENAAKQISTSLYGNE